MTQIFICCRPGNTYMLLDITLSCISNIKEWICLIRLKLNPAKTESLWCTTHRRLHLIDEIQFTIGNVTIQPATSVRNLGVLMDLDLSLRSHITRLTWTCFRALQQARAISRSLTTDASRMLVSTAVLSRIDYFSCIFAGLPDFSLNRLQQVMNAWATVIYCLRQYDHISDVLQDLHWLWVPQCIEFKLCLTVYKTLHNLAQSYLAEPCIPVTAVAARRLLRSSPAGNLVVPNSRSEFGKRAFIFAGPHVWNNLPQMIKSSTSVAVFKKQLKTSFQTMLQTLLILIFLFTFICIILLCNCKVPLRYFRICCGAI